MPCPYLFFRAVVLGVGLERLRLVRCMGQRHGLALLAWMLVAAGLRFWDLDAKTPWSDEWATLVFSLGHSFQTIPLDQLLSLDELLAIARLDNTSAVEGLGNVWQYLMTESTHPPLYFWLTHLWLRFWQGSGELVGLGMARSLSALLGIFGIPAAYGLGYWVMAGARSVHRHRVAVWAAALMALSPFGVYLAQEARHYTLALLWVMASLGYFVLAWRALRTPKHVGLSGPAMLLWVGVNGLGLATHYFVGLVLAAEGFALAGLAALQWRTGAIAGDDSWRWRRTVGQIGLVAGGALLAALPWIPFWLSIPGDRLTEWISQDSSLLERWLMPLLRVLGWLATMVMLLPVEQVPVWAIALSGLGLLAALLWCLPPLGQSLKLQVQAQNPAVEALLVVQGVGLGLVMVAIYLWQKDLSLATRYFFVFLPGMVLLGAMGLAQLPMRQGSGLGQRRVMPVLLALGFAGSLAVTTGYAFQKPDRPDLVVQQILADAEANQPQLMLTMEKTHEQLSEMLSLAWEWNQAIADDSRSVTVKPEQLGFLVTRRGGNLAANTSKVYEGSVEVPRPFQLWEFNLAEGVVFEVFACEDPGKSFYRVGGYRFKQHQCR